MPSRPIHANAGKRAHRVVIAVAAALGAGCRHAPPPPEVLTVSVQLPGASAPEVESAVSTPAEQALGMLPDLIELRSESRAGLSEIRVSMRAGTDALTATRAALSSVSRQLPTAADPPVLAWAPPREPPLRLALRAPELDAQTLRKLALELVAQPLQMLPGVGEVALCGGAEREIAVHIDDRRLAAFGLAPHAVVEALRDGGAKSAEELGALALPGRPGVSVRLADVAQVESGARRPSCVALLGGVPALLLDVKLQRAADAAKTRAAIVARVDQARATLPPGVTLELQPEPPLTIELRLPAGTSPEAVLDAARRLGPARLARWDARKPDRLEIAADELPASPPPGVMVRVLRGAGAGPAELELLVLGPDLEALDRLAAELVGKLRARPEIAAAGTVEASSAPRLDTAIDGARLSSLGVDRRDVEEALALAADGIPAGRLGDAPIRVQLGSGGLAPERFEAIHVRGTDGAVVPLSAVVTVRALSEPPVILHVDRQRAVAIWMRPRSEMSDKARAALAKELVAGGLPPGVFVVGPR